MGQRARSRPRSSRFPARRTRRPPVCCAPCRAPPGASRAPRRTPRRSHCRGRRSCVVRASVLVVDDDATFRVTAAWLLRAAGLCVVGEAGTAAEGLGGAVDLRPDAILLDIGLPDEDGLVLAARLSRLPSHPRVLLTSS